MHEMHLHPYLQLMVLIISDKQGVHLNEREFIHCNLTKRQISPVRWCNVEWIRETEQLTWDSFYSLEDSGELR